MSSNKKKLIISKTSRRGDIFLLSIDLRQLVLDYLQFDEALDLFIYFNVNKPKRPALYLDDLEYLKYLEDKEDHKTGHAEFYIEHKDSARLNKDNLLFLMKLTRYYTFYFVCPNCEECSPIKFRKWDDDPDSNYIYSVRGFCLYQRRAQRIQSFCFCRFEYHIEDQKSKGRNLKNPNIRDKEIFFLNESNIDDIFYYVYNLKNKNKLSIEEIS